jgi:hypothetical protein
MIEARRVAVLAVDADERATGAPTVGVQLERNRVDRNARLGRHQRTRVDRRGAADEFLEPSGDGRFADELERGRWRGRTREAPARIREA